MLQSLHINTQRTDKEKLKSDPRNPDEGASGLSSEVDVEENGFKLALFDLGLPVIKALSDGDTGGLMSV